MSSWRTKGSSTKDLEQALRFKFLLHNVFEEKDDVLARGLASTPTDEAIQLGTQFVDKIEAAYISDVSIRRVSDEVGYGLFAEEVIESGSYVGEYTGIVRKNDVRRYLEPLNNYCYEYPVPDSLGRSFVIDATQGNLTRFINHSFTPNLRPVHVYHGGFYHLIFLAIKRIELGNQLFYDYGKNYWYLRGVPKEF